MKRPMLWVSVPYVLGLTLSSVIARQYWLPVCGVVTLVMLAVVLRRRALWKYVLLGTLSCLTACCVYWCRETTALEQQAVFDGQETTFTGTVCYAAVYPSGYARYYLKGRLHDEIPAKVELFCEDAGYAYGDTLTLEGTPELFRSGYLFDSVCYAKSHGVFLSFGNETRCTDYEPERHASLRSVIYRWRSRMTQRILQCMGDETGPMLTGMLFGDKTSMSRSSRLVMNRMGIGHVLAVSGLHLDFLALCVAWLLERLRVGRRTTFLLMAVLCGLFVICAGETVSVKRACIMLLIRESGKLQFRMPDALNSLCIAAFLLGVFNPFVVNSAAFWLSCSAVWGIAVLAPYMLKNMKRETVPQTLLYHFMSFVWAFLGILPVCAVFYRELSLLTPLSNTLLVPVCMASMLLGVLAVLFGAHGPVAELLLAGADWLNSVVLDVSCTVGRLPWTHAAAGSNLLLILLLPGIALVLCVQLAAKNRRYTSCTVAAVIALTCVVYGVRQALHSEELRIAVLGEENSCVLAVTAGNEAILLDMTGQSALPAYAQAYLTEVGTERLESLYLAKPSERSAQRYAQYLTLLPPERVILLTEEGEDFPDVLGVRSKTETHREQLFHGAYLTVEEDRVLLEYAGVTVQCGREQAVTGEPDVLVICGRSKAALPACGILIIPDPTSPYEPDGHTYIGENNLELTIQKDGTCRVRRLYGDS